MRLWDGIPLNIEVAQHTINFLLIIAIVSEATFFGYYYYMPIELYKDAYNVDDEVEMDIDRITVDLGNCLSNT